MTGASLRGDCISVELSPADAGACLELSVAAGWNQTAEDWWMMLTMGRGFGFRAGQTLVATALFLPYRSNLGWIGMVLVDAEYRRRGLATALMQDCIAASKSAGLTAMLDATADGREVYAGMGFVDGARITRFGCRAVEQGPQPAVLSGTIQPAERQSFGEVVTLDADVMGGSREGIVLDIMRRAPERCFVHVDDEGVVNGFALGRPGRMAAQIGPIVAPGIADATSLVRHVVARSTGPLIIDVHDTHGALQSELTGLGFRPQRSFIRMARANETGASGFQDPSRMFAIAGPAIG